MDSSNAVHVARGASYLIFQNVMTSTAMVVSLAILARLITVKEMGIMAVLLLVSGLSQVIATLSLQLAATRFIAQEMALGKRRTAASVFYQCIRTTLLLATPVAAAIFVAAGALSSQLLGDNSYVVLFQILSIDVLFFAGMLPVLSGTVLGLQRFKESAMLGTINTAVRQFLIITLVILFNSFTGLIVAWVVADLFAASLYVVYVTRILGRPNFDFSLSKLLGFSWPLSLSDAVSFAYGSFDRALLLAFVPLATLGVYNATIIAFYVLVNITGAVASALFPTYSALQGSQQRESLSNAIQLASRHVLFIVVPLAFGLLATARPALTLFVGDAYVEGSEPLMILAGTFGFTLVGTVLGPMLLALAETRVASSITLASVGVSVVSAFVLLPVWGMVGASIARGLAMALGTSITIIVLTRRITLRLDVQAMTKSLTAGTVMAVTLLAIQIPLYSKFLLPVYAIVGLMVYLATLRLLKALRPDDIDLIRRFLGNRLGFAAYLLGKILLTT